jgi:hypothetical protein
MCYTLDDHAKYSIEGPGFNSNNQEGSEEETEARYDKTKDEEILEKNLEQEEQMIRQQSEDKCDKGYTKLGLGLYAKNPREKTLFLRQEY